MTKAAQTLNIDRITNPQDLRPFDTILIKNARNTICFPFHPDDASYQQFIQNTNPCYLNEDDVIIFMGMRRARISNILMKHMQIAVFLVRGRLYWTYQSIFKGMQVQTIGHMDD